MDTAALVVILVSAAVGATALWIGAGWLRQAARSKRQQGRRFQASAQRAPRAPPVVVPRAAPITAAAALAMPVLEHGLAPAGSDTAWPTTGFPTTEPMRDSELPGLEPGFAFAETQPMPLHPC